MSDKKNIDRLFQEKFKDFEVFPEPNVWKGIEKELVKKKKRRIIPLWLRLAGAAAILLLLIRVGYKVYNNSTEQNTPDIKTITNTDTNDKELKRNESSKDNLNSVNKANKENTETTQIEENLITAEGTRKNNATIKKVNTVKQYQIAENDSKNVEKVVSQENVITPQQEKSTENQLNRLELNEDSKETKVTLLEDNEKTKRSNLLEEVEKQNILTNVAEVSTKKWSVGSMIGPVFLNTSGSGSPIDPSISNNSKTSNNTISYGLKVNYKISKKFSLQSGIQNVDLAYSTENVAVIASSALLNNSKTNISSNVGAMVEVSSTALQHSETFSQRSPFDSDGSLDQSYSYVEVPLEAKYAILEKKLGVNLVGGVSTYFLYDNDVSITSFGKKTSLGEASNLNDLNFSGNVGLDLNYNLSPSIYLNASPMLKYQLNTFSENSGGFKPYFFGVYGGLNFRF